MYSQSDINDAVEGGALSEEQATSLRSFIAARNGAPTGDDEHLRFVLGFNDIFVTIACAFALIAVGWLGTLIPISGRSMGMGPIPIQAPFAALFVAAAAWGLAEIFTRKRHTALPSILLTITFAWGVAFFLLLLLASGGGMRGEGGAIVASLSFAAGAGAAFLHWKRFHVPVAIATAAGFAVLAIVMLLALGMRSQEPMMIVLLLAGVGIFLCAMWWDSQDPLRYTRKSDVAFWLHWLAGALVVSSLSQLFGVSTRVDDAVSAIVILVLYLLLGLVALVVNRKIYLIAGLTPLLSAIQSLIGGGYQPRYPDYDYGPVGANPYGSPYSSYPMQRYGSSESVETVMITVLIIGTILVLLAIYWAPVRRRIVGILPEGLRARLPATGAEPATQAETFD